MTGVGPLGEAVAKSKARVFHAKRWSGLSNAPARLRKGCDFNNEESKSVDIFSISESKKPEEEKMPWKGVLLKPDLFIKSNKGVNSLFAPNFGEGRSIKGLRDELENCLSVSDRFLRGVVRTLALMSEICEDDSKAALVSFPVENIWDSDDKSTNFAFRSLFSSKSIGSFLISLSIS